MFNKVMILPTNILTKDESMAFESKWILYVNLRDTKPFVASEMKKSENLHSHIKKKKRQQRQTGIQGSS